MPFKYMFRQRLDVSMNPCNLDSGSVFKQVKTVKEIVETKLTEIFVSHGRNLKVDNTTLQLTANSELEEEEE